VWIIDECSDRKKGLWVSMKSKLWLRKSFFSYFVILFGLGHWINFPLIHTMRSGYLTYLYTSAPQTQDWSVGVLFADYYVHLNPKDPESWAVLAESYKVINDEARSIWAYQKAQELRQEMITTSPGRIFSVEPEG
jgi:hypothetical protein